MQITKEQILQLFKQDKYPRSQDDIASELGIVLDAINFPLFRMIGKRIIQLVEEGQLVARNLAPGMVYWLSEVSEEELGGDHSDTILELLAQNPQEPWKNQLDLYRDFCVQYPNCTIYDFNKAIAALRARDLISRTKSEQLDSVMFKLGD